MEIKTRFNLSSRHFSQTRKSKAYYLIRITSVTFKRKQKLKLANWAATIKVAWLGLTTEAIRNFKFNTSNTNVSRVNSKTTISRGLGLSKENSTKKPKVTFHLLWWTISHNWMKKRMVLLVRRRLGNNQGWVRRNSNNLQTKCKIWTKGTPIQ